MSENIIFQLKRVAVEHRGRRKIDALSYSGLLISYLYFSTISSAKYLKDENNEVKIKTMRIVECDESRVD